MIKYFNNFFNPHTKTVREILRRNLSDKILGASNFTYGELIKSDTAQRCGIQNIPGESEWRNLEVLAYCILQPIRREFGPIIITSGYRSKELCLKIGSSINSNHTRGEAADLEPVSDIPLIEIIEFIYHKLEFRELIAEYFPNGWIHVAYRRKKKGNTRQLKLKDKDHNYTHVSIDYLKKLYKK